jgi:hypothetical protein
MFREKSALRKLKPSISYCVGASIAAIEAACLSLLGSTQTGLSKSGRRSPLGPLGIVFPLLPEKQFTSTLI